MSSPIHVRFPGGLRVDAESGGLTIRTDQSVANGGEGSAPEPYALFLASLAACAGYYVLKFCRARGLATDGIDIVQDHEFTEPGHVLARVHISIALPASFPARYRDAVVRAAETCAVRKAIAAGPEVLVETRDLP